MTNLDGCQIPCLPKFSEGSATVSPQPFVQRIKRMLVMPWNYYVKRWLKKAYHQISDSRSDEKNVHSANMAALVLETGSWCVPRMKFAPRSSVFYR